MVALIKHGALLAELKVLFSTVNLKFSWPASLLTFEKLKALLVTSILFSEKSTLFNEVKRIVRVGPNVMEKQYQRF